MPRWSLESAGLIVFEKRLGALTDRVKWADDLVKLNIEVSGLFRVVTSRIVIGLLKPGLPAIKFFLGVQGREHICIVENNLKFF